MKKLILILLLFTIIFSQKISQEIEDSAVKWVLNGNLNVSKVEPDSSPYIIEVEMNISNPTKENLTLYAYEKYGNIWRKIGKVNGINSGENKSFNLTFRFEYNGITSWKNYYAIIGAEKLYGFKFSIEENWSNYEKKMKDYLFYIFLIIVPILFLVLIFILFFSEKVAISRKVYGKYPVEYTQKTLFEIPKDAPLRYKFILLLANPILWTVVLIAVLIFFALIFKFDGIERAGIFVFSLIFAAFFPVLFALLTWYFDFYEREPLRFICAMFFWGVISAGISYVISSYLVSFLKVPSEIFLIVFGGLFISPVVEEVVKSIGILVFSTHHQFDDTLDGLLYGFCVGCGFAFVENLFYFTMKVDPLLVGYEVWISTILWRSFFNTLAHGFFVGFLGAFLGFYKGKIENFTISYLPAIFFAIILHLIFNLTAIIDTIAIASYRATSFVFNSILIFICLIAFLIIYIVGLNETKKRIRVFY